MAKIVAQTDAGHLVEMTKTEIAQVMGYAGLAYLPKKNDRVSFNFKNGAEFDVSAIYKQIQKWFDLKKTRQNAANNLRAMAATMFEEIDELIFDDPRDKDED